MDNFRRDRRRASAFRRSLPRLSVRVHCQPMGLSDADSNLPTHPCQSLNRCQHNVYLRHVCPKCVSVRWVRSRGLRDRTLGTRLCPKDSAVLPFDCLPRGVSALTPPRTFHTHMRLCILVRCVDGVCTCQVALCVVCMHSPARRLNAPRVAVPV